MKWMRLTLRSQLLLAFVGLVVGSTAVLGSFAYRASRESLEAEARRAVGIAAEGREQALETLLRTRQQRADGFLISVTSSCGEVAPSGRLGWELGCVGIALSEFRATERAQAAVLSYRNRGLAAVGRWTASQLPVEGQLARVNRAANGRAHYTMVAAAAKGDLVLKLRFPIEDLYPIFLDRYGLGATGEAFLTDAEANFLTPPRYSADSETELPLRDCLAGNTGEDRAKDYRGAEVIHGFRPVSVLGGGCVSAHLGYDEALSPALQLRDLLFFAGAGFVLIGTALSFAAARTITKPIGRLAASARALQAGDFNQAVPVRGPKEVRDLGQAFSATAKSIGDLVRREQSARMDAEAANRSKDEFLATLSHELRTPLSAILGWISMLHANRLDPVQRGRAIDAIERSARAQAQLVDDLLDVSRIITGHLRLKVVPVRLGGIVESALEAVRPAAEAKGIRLRTVLEDPALSVVGDSSRLQQIVWNLVSNAVKFTPTGGLVEIQVNQADGQAEIAVRDSGIGIPPDFLPHVFERFRQADGTTTRPHGGLGLGLAIVRHLVELHGGSVSVESEGENRGTTFRVRLPLRSATAASTSQAARSEMPRAARAERLDHLRILVVDDDVDTQEVLATMLQDAGADVKIASSANEARRTVEAWRPNFLIADIGMPVEDGYSLMRSLRDAGQPTAEMPAIALTAYVKAEDVESALAAGFQVHMPKPVDREQLVHAVASLGQRAG